jgi:hypothetical protein
MITGTYIIRAFKKVDFFKNKFLILQHNYVVAYSNINSAKHWIGIVTDLAASFFIGGAAYFGVLSKTLNYVDNPGIVSLALTWSF